MRAQEELLKEEKDQKPITKKKFYLADKHHQAVKDILKRNITKHAKRKGCDRCGLTGIRLITEENLIHPCRCVCRSKARTAWLKYCEGFKDLKKRFIDNRYTNGMED